MNPGLRHRFREIVARWGPSPVRAPLAERFPHTTAVFTQYAAAHKGVIPPLCAPRCCVNQVLVCGSGRSGGSGRGVGQQVRVRAEDENRVT